jgi:hypothetical protein
MTYHRELQPKSAEIVLLWFVEKFLIVSLLHAVIAGGRRHEAGGRRESLTIPSIQALKMF